MTSSDPRSPDRAPGTTAGDRRPRWLASARAAVEPHLERLAVVAAVLPFASAAVALLVGVGDTYRPASDHALSEMLVRDVPAHLPGHGLYSRDDWSHPGPLLYVLLAPFYWVTGRSSIGLPLGTLAINAAAVAGMVVLARRRAGRSAMAATLLGCLLLMRTLGAEELHDVWNVTITTLPFGAMVMLTWSLLDRDRWMLPWAVLVAGFLAQTHVGFVALALPLLALGSVGLAVRAWRDDGTDGLRSLARPVGAATAVGVITWLPTAVDVVTDGGGNMRRIVRWFLDSEGGVQGLAAGLRVVGGQLTVPPEWAVRVAEPSAATGESPYLTGTVVPWLLIVVVAAGIVAWRRAPAGRSLVVALVATAGLGVAAVARTVGPAFQYRLAWTYIMPVVAFVLVGLAVRALVADRPEAGRPVAAVTGVAIVALTVVTSVAGITSGVPQEGDSDAVTAISEQVIDDLEGIPGVVDGDGVVLVTDPYRIGAWYSRALVLQLERHGIDARFPAERVVEVAEHRVLGDEPVAVELIVMTDRSVAPLVDDPGVEMVADWSGVSDDEVDAYHAAYERLESEVPADEVAARDQELTEPLREAGGTVFWRVGVFRRTG